jgi:hypothetical protein
VLPAAACHLQIVAGLPALQNAFLRYTGLSGPLSCDLVANPSLTRLSISGNNVTGSLPACMLQVGDAAGCDGYLAASALCNEALGWALNVLAHVAWYAAIPAVMIRLPAGWAAQLDLPAATCRAPLLPPPPAGPHPSGVVPEPDWAERPAA